MKSAYRRGGLIVASLLAGVSLANAAGPVSVDGWRYVEGPNDLHIYVCDGPSCGEGSRVFWHFDPPNSVTYPEIWRQYEVAVSGLLDEPSRKFPIGIFGSNGGGIGFAISSDGSRFYYQLGDVEGSKWHASLTSASRDETLTQTNLERFEAALERIRN